MRAVNELEELNPAEGTFEKKRLIWAKEIANALNACLGAGFDTRNKLYED